MRLVYAFIIVLKIVRHLSVEEILLTFGAELAADRPVFPNVGFQRTFELSIKEIILVRIYCIVGKRIVMESDFAVV